MVNEKIILSFHYDFEVNNICKWHYDKTFVTYPKNQKKCCNVFKVHKKSPETVLKKVDVELALQIRDYTNFSVKPYQLLCKASPRSCHAKLLALIEDRVNEIAMMPSQSQSSTNSRLSNWSCPDSEPEIKDNEKEVDFDQIMQNIRKGLR